MGAMITSMPLQSTRMSSSPASSNPIPYSMLPSGFSFAAMRNDNPSIPPSAAAARIRSAACGVMRIIRWFPSGQGAPDGACVGSDANVEMPVPLSPGRGGHRPPGTGTLARAHMVDESGRPAVASYIAQVRVAGQHVFVHDPVVPAIDSGTTQHFECVLQPGRQVLETRVVEFVSGDFTRLSRGTCQRPRT